MICGAEDGFLCVADADSGKVLLSLDDSREIPNSAEWSPDGGRIVMAMDTNRAQVRDAATGKSLGALLHASRTRFAAYSPDGKWIATLCEDRIVRIWDAASLQEVLNLSQEGFVTSSTLSFASESQQVAILGWAAGQRAARKSRLLVYPLNPLAEAMKWPLGSLTPDERDQFEVGGAEERAAYRATWQTESVFEPTRDSR